MDLSERFETFCIANDILINHVNGLSGRVRGYCYYDGTYYNVMLNASLSDEQLRKTTIHEIVHVLENHFLCPTHMVEEIELEVEEIVQEIYQEFIIDFNYI